MALFKQITLASGHTAEYWIVTHAHFDKCAGLTGNGQTLVRLTPFKDEATSKAEAAGKRVGLQAAIFAESKEIVFDGELTVAQVYAALREPSVEFAKAAPAIEFFKDAASDVVVADSPM